MQAFTRVLTLRCSCWLLPLANPMLLLGCRAERVAFQFQPARQKLMPSNAANLPQEKSLPVIMPAAKIFRARCGTAAATFRASAVALDLRGNFNSRKPATIPPGTNVSSSVRQLPNAGTARIKTARFAHQPAPQRRHKAPSGYDGKGLAEAFYTALLAFVFLVVAVVGLLASSPAAIVTGAVGFAVVVLLYAVGITNDLPFLN